MPALSSTAPPCRANPSSSPICKPPQPRHRSTLATSSAASSSTKTPAPPTSSLAHNPHPRRTRLDRRSHPRHPLPHLAHRLFQVNPPQTENSTVRFGVLPTRNPGCRHDLRSLLRCWRYHPSAGRRIVAEGSRDVCLIGIESNPAAVRDAKVNVSVNLELASSGQRSCLNKEMLLIFSCPNKIHLRNWWSLICRAKGASQDCWRHCCMCNQRS